MYDKTLEELNVQEGDVLQPFQKDHPKYVVHSVKNKILAHYKNLISPFNYDYDWGKANIWCVVERSKPLTEEDVLGEAWAQ